MNFSDARFARAIRPRWFLQQTAGRTLGSFRCGVRWVRLCQGRREHGPPNKGALGSSVPPGQFVCAFSGSRVRTCRASAPIPSATARPIGGFGRARGDNSFAQNRMVGVERAETLGSHASPLRTDSVWGRLLTASRTPGRENRPSRIAYPRKEFNPCLASRIGKHGPQPPARRTRCRLRSGQQAGPRASLRVARSPAARSRPTLALRAHSGASREPSSRSPAGTGTSASPDPNSRRAARDECRPLNSIHKQKSLAALLHRRNQPEHETIHRLQGRASLPHISDAASAHTNSRLSSAPGASPPDPHVSRE